MHVHLAFAQLQVDAIHAPRLSDTQNPGIQVSVLHLPIIWNPLKCRMSQIKRKIKEKPTMALTRDFRETIRDRAQREPKFRQALLREAIELMLSGDERTGRGIRMSTRR
jgi:hypothetical protein